MTALRVIEPPEIHDSESVILGVVLAAGTSTRFGAANKLTRAIDGKTVVRRAVESICESHVTDVYVVVGHEAPRIRRLLAGVDVTCVTNDAYATGQASSVRVGIEAVPDESDAVVIALGDMPFVRVTSINKLIAAYATGEYTALAAAYDGQRGNPVLFDAQHFDELGTLRGDSGARDVLLSSPSAALVETGDPGVIRDIDTPRDLERYSA